MIRRFIQGCRAVEGVIRETIDGYLMDRADLMAAALAFYTLFAMAPLVLIATVVAGFVLGAEAARSEISSLISAQVGPEGAATVNGLVDGLAAASKRSGALASLIAGALTIFTASKLFQQLRRALNQVWNVGERARERALESSLWRYVRQRVLAFLLVFASAPILLVVFASRALLSGLHDALFHAAPMAGALVTALQLGFSVVLVWLVVALIFRYVSDNELDWHSIGIGALITSLIFNLGNIAVGLYLGRATPSGTYGAAGSLIVVLLWLKFSTSMFLFGAELTQVYARRRNA